ncbi:PREDICTED: cathepsin O-like [Polistes canadensis]|uniref:cathepsin O-like n=1 Tax=Polistes canadensis TaxID=91411 RepID=UPI000718CF51|nr:PREDICTED: cathepsin O-like [Polistes canadensis]
MEWKTVAVTILIVSLCFFAIPIRVGPDNNGEDMKLFENYVVRYNKSYRNNPTEYSDRFKRFQRSLRHIEKMNGLRSSHKSAYYGITEFSDMLEDEFLQQILYSDLSVRGRKHVSSTYHHEHHKRKERNHLEKRAAGIPLKIDWRQKGIISPVKSQGPCGACWAFSTVEVVESMYALKNGSLYLLSVQEMIDCAKNSNLGCEGGDICSLLAWLKSTKSPILPESNYPLTRMTDTCKLKGANAKTSGIKVMDFTCDSFIDSEEELLITLATHGPVAAAVNALSWQNYLGGIIQYHCDSAFTSLNHAVQIIGYDKSDTIPYYIIKNSWGNAFGDRGYIYIAIGSNLCGIANQVSAVDIIYK